jgi:hypothetical protein
VHLHCFLLSLVPLSALSFLSLHCTYIHLAGVFVGAASQLGRVSGAIDLSTPLHCCFFMNALFPNSPRVRVHPYLSLTHFWTR